MQIKKRISPLVPVAILLFVLSLGFYYFVWSRPATPAELDQAIAANEMVTFRSNDGKWEGTDGDIDFTFLPGNRVEIIFFGEAVNEFQGTYTINQSGQVTFTIQYTGYRLITLSGPMIFALHETNYSVDPMTLRRDRTSLLLRPLDASKSFSRWNLRPVPQKEQDFIKERWLERSKITQILEPDPRTKTP